MNSANINADWSNAAFDARHVISAGLNYSIPAFTESRFGDGWQINTITTILSGSPFNITAGTDRSGTGDRSDRVNLVGNPFSGISGNQFFNPTAFANPAPGTFGTLPRNAYYGPWFKTVDLSVFKTTKLDRGVSLQLRFEIFNVFNWVNWANPGSTLSSSTSFGLLTNTRNGNSAPGIGAGEPRNIQLAAKVLFYEFLLFNPWQPHLGAFWKGEAALGHADDCHRFVIHGESRSDHLRRAVKSSLPELLTEHDDRTRLRAKIVVSKEAADQWAHLRRLEKVARNRRAAQGLGVAVDPHVKHRHRITVVRWFSKLTCNVV
jgi:hypothetical protein